MRKTKCINLMALLLCFLCSMGASATKWEVSADFSSLPQNTTISSEQKTITGTNLIVTTNGLTCNETGWGPLKVESGKFTADDGVDYSNKWFYRVNSTGTINLKLDFSGYGVSDVPFKPGDELYVTALQTTAGSEGKIVFVLGGTRREFTSVNTSSDTYTITNCKVTLTAEDINADGSVTISNNSAAGMGDTRIFGFKANAYTYSVNITNSENSTIGSPYFTINGKGHYGVGQGGDVGKGTTVKFYPNISEQYKETHLASWYKGSERFSWDLEPQVTSFDGNLTLDVRYVEASNISVGFANGSAQEPGKITIMQNGNWDRGTKLLCHGGTNLTLTAVDIANCTFLGWFDNENATGTALTTEKTYNITTSVGKHSYYAKYKSNNYKVKITNSENSSIGAPYFTINGEGHYGIGYIEEVASDATVKFYPNIYDHYKDTHLALWFKEDGNQYNWDIEPQKASFDGDFTLDVRYFEGARITVGFANGSAQKTDALTIMQGAWNRGTNVLCNGGTGLTLTATDIDNCTFLGWYSDEDAEHRLTENKTYNIADGPGKHAYYAKYRSDYMRPANPAYNGDPTCGGGHYMNMGTAYPSEEVQYYTHDGSVGSTVTTGGQDASISFFFTNAQDMTDLKSWAINCLDGASGNVTMVGFYDAEGKKLKDFYNSPTSRTLTDADVAALSGVKEIRVGFRSNTTTTINWFNLNLHGLDKPTLASPTTNEMTIFEGDILQLRITDIHGYWREYTNGDYNVAIHDRIKDNEFSSTYDITGLQAGHDYYFGVKDGTTCKNGEYHISTMEKVHVKVLTRDTSGMIYTDENHDAVNADGAFSGYNGIPGYGDLTYKKVIKTGGEDTEVRVVFNNMHYASRDSSNPSCNGVKLIQGRPAVDGLTKDSEVKVYPPSGYKVKTVTFNFGEVSPVNVSFNSGNGGKWDEGSFANVSYTNNSTTDEVRMVIRSQAPEGERELHIVSVNVELEALPGEPIDNAIKTLGESFNQKGRQYRIYVPKKVIAARSAKVPVLFSLHGGGNNFNSGVQNYNSVADAEPEGIIVIYPQGGQYVNPHFNGGVAPTGDAHNWLSTGADNADIQFFKDILSDLKTNPSSDSELAGLAGKIDEDRVYITGFSNGGMMAYAAANAASDVFAAFSSINGLPMNDFHLRHHGARPVPFIHIHSTNDLGFVKWTHMPTIIDNMLARNGCGFEPTEDTKFIGGATYWTNENANTPTTFRKRVYSSPRGAGFPFAYYEIGTENGSSGPGHWFGFNINGQSTEQIIWNFMKEFHLSDACDKTLEFKPEVSAQHGWTVNDGLTLAKYGESGGYKDDAQNNVYHSIQLKAGDHFIKFNASNPVTTKKVTARLVKLGQLSQFDNPMNQGFSVSNEEVFSKEYFTTGDICFKYTSDEAAEYMLEILRGNESDNTTISNVSIATTGEESGSAAQYNATDFAGYFPYNNRLRAQWNFDLCDGIRFRMEALNGTWLKDETNCFNGNGTIVYTYNASLNNQQLTYDGDYPIPVSAELLFKAEPGKVKFYVNMENGEVTGTNLVCEPGVQMTVPYVENSCRSDYSKEDYPHILNKDDVENNRYPELASKVVGYNADNTAKDADGKAIWTNHEYFENCMHHMKRDMLYVALAGGKDFLWGDGGYIEPYHVVNGQLSDVPLFRYTEGETVNNVHMYKCDFVGVAGEPCTFQFKKETVFDRIGVNRNLTASYYSEYIQRDGFAVPMPGLRFSVKTQGLRVASDADTPGYWDGAISMTYGGWSLNDMSYKDVNNNDVQDSWSTLTTYDGNVADFHKIPTPSDGFPVISMMNEMARSENLHSSVYEKTNEDKYHAQNEGKFFTGSYKENITPWSLPCRGAYVKFEPTYPGVLNVHVVQTANEKYYIADEFGKLVQTIPNTMLYKKVATEDNTISEQDGGFKTKYDDYVKYSLNVYPGKTYYLFSNTAGLGFAGFFFEPYVTRISDTYDLREDVLMETITLSDELENGYQVPTTGFYPAGAHEISVPGTHGVYAKKVYSPKSPDALTAEHKDDKTNTQYWQEYTINYSLNAVTCKLNRHFESGKWTSICLPFSMNKYQMQDQFGKDTKVIMLRDVQDKESGIPTSLTTAHFIMHENQDIIAGYPYFILPSQVKFSDHIEANVSLSETAPTPITVKSQGANTSIYGDANYGGIGCYEFTGNLEKVEVPAGSYVMANTGKLTRVSKPVYAKPYRAYLKFVGSDYESEAKAIMKYNLGDEDEDYIDTEATDIEDILFKSGILTDKKNVYSVNGQLVRANTDNLQDLPKGIYIVNGKKYIVK